MKVDAPAIQQRECQVTRRTLYAIRSESTAEFCAAVSFPADCALLSLSVLRDTCCSVVAGVEKSQ